MKLLKTFLFVISIIIGFVLYTNVDSKPICFCSTFPTTYLDTLKTEIVRYGNISAYIELLDSLTETHSPEYLNYAIIMRNKYNYLPAQKDIKKFEKEYKIKF